MTFLHGVFELLYAAQKIDIDSVFLCLTKFNFEFMLNQYETHEPHSGQTMEVFVADSIELWVLKLQFNISDRLKSIGLIPDVCDIVFDYVRPYGADETYLNRYSEYFETELIVAGVTYRLHVDIYSSNYSNYDGCLEHDREIMSPHMEIIADASKLGDRKGKFKDVMQFYDVLRCFDMSPAHIEILANDIRSSYELSDGLTVRPAIHLISGFKKIAHMFMDTIWFGPPPQ